MVGTEQMEWVWKKYKNKGVKSVGFIVLLLDAIKHDCTSFPLV